MRQTYSLDTNARVLTKSKASLVRKALQRREFESMKVVVIILGVLMLIGGVYCLATPIATYAALGWLVGLAMLVEGIGSIATWNERRKMGFADGWTLAGAIVSIVLGLILLFSFVAQWAVDLFIAYMIAAWLVVGGIARIVASLHLRKFLQEEGPNAAGPSWVLLLILGILVVLLGVLCLFNPLSVMMGVGFMLGISIVCVGIDLIVGGARM
ncbi:MAG TPA: hypothetical protein DCP91_04500 [Eggerthellaceae bacterium]|nr:hypothetical protein [Eggerthellaceae bacterium]